MAPRILSQGNLLGETSEGNRLIAHHTIREADAVVSKLCHATIQARARNHPCSPLRSSSGARGGVDGRTMMRTRISEWVRKMYVLLDGAEGERSGRAEGGPSFARVSVSAGRGEEKVSVSGGAGYPIVGMSPNPPFSYRWVGSRLLLAAFPQGCCVAGLPCQSYI